MKIEKVNDHQIRCTLTKADLADRELKISELAYGTEKAKSLFRDMMQQAALKFGFEAEDIPLMIEAIPLNADCIVLIITKVEDPEELDTRFSKFAPSIHDGEEDPLDDILQELNEGADDVLDLFKKIHEGRIMGNKIPDAPKSAIENDSENETEPDAADTTNSEEAGQSAGNLVRMFAFPSLQELIRLAHVCSSFYDGTNSLFRSPEGHYYLTLHEEGSGAEDFNRICNVTSEYGRLEKGTSAMEAYLDEHCDLITKDKALQVLSNL